MRGRRAAVRIPARKTPPLEALIFRLLVRPAIRRSFSRVALATPAPRPRPDLPTLIYSNHPSWWDGYMAFLLSDELWRCESYLMMEEPQLARYRFFRYCGVFSVDRHDPREGLRSVAYAAELLRQRSSRVMWIFPQGEITPNDRRPLRTFAGAAQIAKRVAADGAIRCIPLAQRYEFAGEQRPEALLRLGPAHVVAGAVDARKLHAEMDARLLCEVDALHEDVISGATANYTTVLGGRPSVNVLWDEVRARAGIRPRP